VEPEQQAFNGESKREKEFGGGLGEPDDQTGKVNHSRKEEASVHGHVMELVHVDEVTIIIFEFDNREYQFMISLCYVKECFNYYSYQRKDTFYE
jgi:hypothetical protein